MNQEPQSTSESFIYSVFGEDRKVHIPGEVGIWIFILGDMTLYAGLFVGFMLDRAKNVALYNHGAGSLHANIGAISMILLLVSSFFVAMGVQVSR